MSDGRIVSGSDDKTIRVWNMESGESRVLRGAWDKMSGKYSFMILILLLLPLLSSYLMKTRLTIKTTKHRLVEIPDSVEVGLQVFGEITKAIGNLGAVVPLAFGVFIIGRQDKKFEDGIKSTSDLLSKDIKATNDAIKATSDALSKDIKATSDALSKDIKATSDALSKDIKTTSDILTKDIKTTNDALSKDISRLEKIVEKMATAK